MWNDDAQAWLLAQPGAPSLTTAEADARGLLPLSAFRYAERTREPLLVEDATHDDRFAGDSYLRGVERCSLLVVPILNHGTACAMLVLENRLSRAAFTADRLDAVMGLDFVVRAGGRRHRRGCKGTRAQQPKRGRTL